MHILNNIRHSGQLQEGTLSGQDATEEGRHTLSLQHDVGVRNLDVHYESDDPSSVISLVPER